MTDDPTRSALRLPGLFKDAIERPGLRMSEIARRAGVSERRISKACGRLKALVAGEHQPPDHVARFGRALGINPDDLAAALAADERVHEDERARKQREWEAWASEPVEATVLYQQVSPWGGPSHTRPQGTTRDETIAIARHLARETGSSVHVPAFRRRMLYVHPDGSEDLGAIGRTTVSESYQQWTGSGFALLTSWKGPQAHREGDTWTGTVPALEVNVRGLPSRHEALEAAAKAGVERNDATFCDLRLAIRSAGFGWIPILGRWRDLETGSVSEEPALVVPAARTAGEPDPKRLRELVIARARFHSQDAVLWSDPSWTTETIYLDPFRVERKPTFHPSDAAEAFSSTGEKRDGFRFEGLFLAPSPAGWSEAMMRSVSGEIWP
jgi:hypothetical protein